MSDSAICDVLDARIINLALDAADKHTALQAMSEQLKEAGYIDDVDVFVQDILYRESLGETGIGNGIAIPHGQSDTVKKSTIAIAKLTHEIAWETLDGQGVQVILLFAVQNDAEFAKRHLKMLAQVARCLARDEVTERLLHAETADDVIACFS